jgi:hypothetical protein
MTFVNRRSLTNPKCGILTGSNNFRLDKIGWSGCFSTRCSFPLPDLMCAFVLETEIENTYDVLVTRSKSFQLGKTGGSECRSTQKK